jgi:hypothetical protein
MGWSAPTRAKALSARIASPKRIYVSERENTIHEIHLNKLPVPCIANCLDLNRVKLHRKRAKYKYSRRPCWFT